MPAYTYIIPDHKIVKYLLNLDHKRGSSKARFFLARGFSANTPDEFASALFGHGMAYWPGSVTRQSYGVLHELIGELLCPDGSPHADRRQA